ncbi:MAG: DNA mismatch repair endonuclease MutL [Thermoguttaceae bacterium]|jgi:DNA mismatch repair protein MutL|nr:DNA mismatch repair endonuclease MutL [Thermoguttaceae bacterium]
MPIRQLPQSLINKIAAGEVVERPASVVKELMENAVDAGATRIDVSVEKGGMELVRVVDNGHGIAAGELPLAVASHATSKLLDADDLFRVNTLGFRGEALASIAEISRTVLRSRTHEDPAGAELEVTGGTPGAVSPCGCPPGTLVEVHNLFFNTPVRRKFLRAVATEFGHVSEAFTRIALAAPHVHFTLRHNDRSVFDLPASEGQLDRIARFFGRELADHLIYVESADGDIRLSGYAAHPSQSRSNNRMQYVFLNGRHIRDRALQHALTEAYRGLLTVGRYPIAFLQFTMPPDLVDVNVHPTKLEVRFQDSGQLYSQLLSTLRGKFLTTNLDTRIRASAEASAESDDLARQMRQELVDWAKGEAASWQRPEGAHGEAGSGLSIVQGRAPSGGSPLNLTRIDRPWPAAAHGPCLTAAPAEARPEPAAAHAGPAGRLTGLQVHNAYLVAETEEGVTIIDQHALHERILYEQLRSRIETGPIETQQLLVPEPVDLAAAEAAAAMENRELLAQLGLIVEPFGGDTVLISGYPAMLANLNPAEVLREVLDRILAGGKQPERRDLLDDLLHSIACKAAVKAGDRLTPEEISELLRQRHLVQDAHHCPHGRPTALVFTREELDKQFRRT